MDTQLFTLSKIFTERLFRIPDYQRGYAWTETQLKDFWSDILQLEANDNHYTGVLTLEEVPASVSKKWEDDLWIISSKGYQPYYLVDGQQRLTTALILIQVIVEQLGLGEKLNYTTKEEIQKKFIFESKDNGISRSYLFGYEKDNPSYEFLKTGIFHEHSSSDRSEDTVYTNNLEKAKNYFIEAISELDQGSVEDIYRKLTQHLLFNTFTISDEVEVCVAFETMNNRGKPLSYLELLKNRLIYLSLKLETDEHDRVKLRNSVNDCWKSIYHNLGRNKDNPLEDDRFLLNHYLIHFGGIEPDQPDYYNRTIFRRSVGGGYSSFLLEERFIAKNIVSPDSEDDRLTLADVYGYVNSLQQAVETWYKILNPLDSDFSPEENLWLEKLVRMDSEGWSPLILAFFSNVSNIKKRVRLLRVIERHLFTVSLLSFDHYRGIGFIPTIVVLLARKLDRGKIGADAVISEISDQTSSMLKAENFNSEFVRQFRSSGFYRWSSIRYFLYEYNLSLQERSKTSRPKITWSEYLETQKDYKSVEHIFPKNARSKYWTNLFGMYTPKQKSALRDSLGNLLPLSKPKNSSLSNKPFPDKVDGTKDAVVGYRYGCYAENEISSLPEWSPKRILDRGILLLEFMEKRWDIKIGDTSEKKKMLGLEFIREKDG